MMFSEEYQAMAENSNMAASEPVNPSASFLLMERFAQSIRSSPCLVRYFLYSKTCQ